MMRIWILALLVLALAPLLLTSGEQCGWQAGGAVCDGGLCCSEWGYCGSTEIYCGNGCQSNCWKSTPPPPPPMTPSPPPPPGGGGGDDVSSVISSELFEEMLMHRSTYPCVGAFYTYEAFLTAANAFPAFGTTGSLETRKREIAAFFGETSQETTGGWDDAPDGKYSWGYCYIKEKSAADCCEPSENYPCVAGKTYCGRGPIQLTHNYNYGLAGEALGLDLLNDPDLVERDPVVAFKTAIWFWMTPQAPKLSCHDVITDQWTPSSADIAAGRKPGLGVITNIINGGIECGHGYVSTVEGRIKFYERYCDMMGIDYGENLDCYNQQHFGLASGGKLVFSSK